MHEKKKKWIIAVVLLVAAVLSFTVIADAFTSDSYVKPRVQYLDKKKTTVLEMSAVAIAASTAITLVPGDAGTPIAEKLADLSKYSIIILSAVFLEKYLINLTAIAAFKVIVPIGLLIAAVCLIIGKDRIRRIGYRLVVCGCLIAAVIPISIYISQAIETTYQMTIDKTLEDAKEDTQEIQDKADDQTALQKFFNGIVGGAKTVVQKFERTLTNMLEAFAVMVVTSILIPVVVYFVLWLILKSLFASVWGGPVPVSVQLPDGAVLQLPQAGRQSYAHAAEEEHYDTYKYTAQPEVVTVDTEPSAKNGSSGSKDA